MKRSLDLIARLKGGLVVSCQAPEGSPLDHPRIIAALAQAAEKQGAAAVRINGSRNIRAVCAAVSVPVIGIEKIRRRGSPVYITPTRASARSAARAGAAIVALDATARRRPGGESLARIIEELKRIGVLIMADVSMLEEGIASAGIGADLVATTLYGYTAATRGRDGPAFALLEKLVANLTLPVILEGRVRTPRDVRRAFEMGAHAVVVGTAITGVEALARAFVDAAPRGRSRAGR